MLLLVTACSDAVKLIRETDTGGIVTYSYNIERGGHMGSPFRKQAFDLIQQKCPTGSRIVRESEVQGYSSAGGYQEGSEGEVRGQRWGIQFECKHK